MDVTRMRQDARTIFAAGIAAVDPERAVRQAIVPHGRGVRWGGPGGLAQKWTPVRGGKITVVGMGKAGAAMARGVEAVCPGVGGLVVVKDGYQRPTQSIEVVTAGHPMPDERGVAAALRIEALLQRAGPDDLTLVLVSGGGSALLPAPLAGVSLAEKQQMTRELLASGADIQTINRARQKCSRLKGGGMLTQLGGGRLLALVLSDVVGDPLDLIASGPTVPPTEGQSAVQGIWRGRPYTNLLVGNNRRCLDGCAAKAQELGYAPTVISEPLTGEARLVGQRLGQHLVEQAALAGPPRARLFGGETTVTLTGQGTGGRNQELALAAASVLEGVAGAVLLSGGTDGTDGPTDAAGAIVDGTSVARGRALGLSPMASLAANDSYSFHLATGDLLITGPTWTNVMDVQLLLSS